MSLKVMVTASSTWAARSLTRALRDEGVTLLSCDCDGLRPARRSKCHFWVHRSDDPEFVGDLVTLCLKHDVDVVLPMRTSDLNAISGARTLFEGIGAHVWPAAIPPHADRATVRRIMDLGGQRRLCDVMGRWLGFA